MSDSQAPAQVFRTRAATTDPRLAAAALMAWLAGFLAVAPPRELALGLGLGVMLAGAAVLMVAQRRRALGQSLASLALVLLVAGLVTVSAGAQGLLAERSELVQAAQSQSRVNLVLRVDQEPRQLPDGFGGQSSWLVEGQAGGVAVVAFVPVQPDESQIRAGHLVQVRATAQLTERDQAARVALTSVTIQDVQLPTGWRRWIFDLRQTLRANSQVLPGDAAGLLPGITVGDRSALAVGLDEAMKATSLTHITAVSGAHVAIVLATILGALQLMGLPRWPRAFIGGVVLLGFATLVGSGPSVLRATLMGLATLFALVSGRVRATLGVLCAAVIGLLVVDPFMARSFGFILSVVATAALITLAPPL
ncbi:MAG: ComEC/Rec2 family competence protein, partial [Micrococcales bacterium]|nr:ComEC/Rec2 family competence protein [Micrococcales bacterium]